MKGFVWLVTRKRSTKGSGTCTLEYPGTCGVNYDPDPDPDPEPEPDKPCKINIPPDFCPIVY